MINKWSALLVLAFLSPVIGIFFGAAELSPTELYQCFVADCATPVNTLIFWEIRLPRVLVGFLVGAGLAVAGATLQNITRNGLADPYLFGVVSGAGLGASIATLLFDSQIGETLNLFGMLPNVSFSLALPVAAFLGAAFAVTLVQALAATSFGGRGENMLLAGVAVSFMLSALSHFLLFLGDPFAANKVIFWLMGSLARVEMWYAWIMLPVVMGSVMLLLLFGRRLDALLLGDENAKTLGVNVTAIRLMALAICAALTACIVAYCGGIGFVGLLIPHIVRRWVGVTSRALIMGCVLVGGSFMVLVDIVARSALSEQEIPIGIITSAIGSVFFLLALRQRQT
ncbi:FecCD family ABC transporter permease [Paraglaciecola polaris]|uniref:Hemin transport system permease protein hmuU n=1 Tax=Paraglaciecola polaris LMG 21857 TaxID=1129793 RepID=K6ZR55_9ALTE|nr:iron ABC transporter permease [Paraglaciecola polaris]GAC31318.1 hemin transport system permease protein hmuU [Paraglaciecola polaris LMG 21857]